MKKQFDFFFKIVSSPNFNLKDYYKNDKTLLKLHKQFEKELTNKFTMKGGSIYGEYNPVHLQEIVNNRHANPNIKITGPGGTNTEEYCSKLRHHLKDQKRDIIYDKYDDNKLILLPTYIDGATGKKFYKEDFIRLNNENNCSISDELINDFVDPNTPTNMPSAASGLQDAHIYGNINDLHGLIFHDGSKFTPKEQQDYIAKRQQNINDEQRARGKSNHYLYQKYRDSTPGYNEGGPATTPATTTTATTTPATKTAQEDIIFEY
jgi:hypothetical protein